MVTTFEKNVHSFIHDGSMNGPLSICFATSELSLHELQVPKNVNLDKFKIMDYMFFSDIDSVFFCYT